MVQSSEFNLNADGIPYLVKALPQYFNDELRYQITINGMTDIMFVFDRNLGRYAPIGDDAIEVPDDVEIAIGNRLNSLSAQE